MNRWHNLYLDNRIHFCTYTVRDWKPLLEGEVVQRLYDEWIRQSDRFDVSILAYVIMPEHVHKLVWAEQGVSIMRFLQRVLGQTSKHLRPGEGGFGKERPMVMPLSRTILPTTIHLRGVIK